MEEKQNEMKRKSHVVLTSHKNTIFKDVPPINWGAKDPEERGPVIAPNKKE